MANMRWGRLTGFGFVGGGVLLMAFLTWLNPAQEVDLEGRPFRWLVAPAIIVGVGVAMIIFPGGQVTVAEVRADWSKRASFWHDARWWVVLSWLTGGVVGGLVGLDYLSNL